jgi:predicted transcriptional regulator
MSIVTHVAVFFALNPNEELTAHDVGIKWDMRPNNVGASLKYAEQTGWVTRTKRADLTARTKYRWIYTAGPLITGMTTPSVSSADPGG